MQNLGLLWSNFCWRHCQTRMVPGHIANEIAYSCHPVLVLHHLKCTLNNWKKDHMKSTPNNFNVPTYTWFQIRHHRAWSAWQYLGFQMQDALDNPSACAANTQPVRPGQWAPQDIRHPPMPGPEAWAQEGKLKHTSKIDVSFGGMWLTRKKQYNQSLKILARHHITRK